MFANYEHVLSNYPILYSVKSIRSVGLAVATSYFVFVVISLIVESESINSFGISFYFKNDSDPMQENS